MKTVSSVCLAALVALSFSGRAQAPSANAEDPIVGKWRWIEKQLVECKSDATFAASPTKRGGTWKLIPATTVERKYSFTWDDGLYVDTVMMSRDGKTLKGKNQDGKPITATRIP